MTTTTAGTIPIPTAPLTAEERATALALRIRERYPRVGAVEVTAHSTGYSVEITLRGGTIRSEFSLDDTTNRMMRHLWNAYADELTLGVTR